jgi:hypothetical protein
MAENSKSGKIVLVVALLVAAGGVTYYFRSPGFHPSKGAYYFDEETGEEMARPGTDVPPLIGKGGKPTIVREFKYSVDGGKTSKVAYYFKYTDDWKKKLEEAQAHGGSVDAVLGELIRAPAPGSKWISFGSDEAQPIVHPDLPPNADVLIMSP